MVEIYSNFLDEKIIVFKKKEKKWINLNHS